MDGLNMAQRDGDRFNFDGGGRDGEDVISVEQPSAEDVVKRHFLELNSDADLSRFDTKRVLNEAFNINEKNVPDGEDQVSFPREDPKKLLKEDADWLDKRRKAFDEEERPKIREKIKPATLEDEEAMNEMARKLYGVEI